MPVDYTSLVVGLAVATILWWLFTRSRPLWREATARVQKGTESVRARRMGDVELEHRRYVLRRAQGMHLASPLFSLTEVIEEPLLMAPPPRIEPDGPVASEDVVTMTVPYMPAWPELAAFYRAPALTLPQALSGGVNLVLIGQPGAGKTIALAHLASMAANRHADLGPLRERMPFLLHAAELDLPVANRKQLLRRFIESTAQQVSVLDAPKVEKFVTNTFRSGRALVLLDGYDELTDQGQHKVAEYVSQLLTEYPRTLIVATGAPEYLNGLLGLGFVPLAVMPWNEERQDRFLGRWLDLWSSNVTGQSMTSPAPATVDASILRSWLARSHAHLTPLELTLKAWAACAGDWTGASNLDAIGVHVRRLAPGSTPPAALESLAIQVMLTAQPVFDPRKAHDWIKEFELPEEASENAPAPEAEAIAPALQKTEPKTQSRRPDATTPGLLGKLASTGLLVLLPGNRMRFVHPVFGSYLAGRGLRVYRAGETLVNQPDWIGKLLTMRYFASHADAGPLVASMLHWSRLPTHRPVLTSARWLRDSAVNAAWRGRVLIALGELIRQPGLPLSLRGQAIVALATSGDPSVAVLFRTLLTSASADVAQLAALGTGIMMDAPSIAPLKGALFSNSLSVRRAACLALVAIGTSAALEAVGEALLMGDDDLRRAAAEALANHPAEGHAMLRDGAGMQDIALRRATAYGLGRIQEQWSLDLLEKLRTEDDQWIVRNAAAEIIEGRARTLDPRAPRPLPPPSESAWLIRFAGTLGIGISAGAPATDVLLAALQSQHGDERLGALDYLKQSPNEGTVKALYAAMFGDDPELREGAFEVVWEIGASGFHLPDPIKFGHN